MHKLLIRRIARVIFALLFLGCSVAFARAGGGGHYGGGGGGHSFGGGGGGGSFSFGGGGYGGGGYSGGGYGGGGGIGYLIFWLFQITFQHPLFMIPFWALIFFFIRQQMRMRGSVASPREIEVLDQRRLEPTRDVNTSVAELKQSDPAFDIDPFFERTKKVFLDIQEAWFKRNLDPVRMYMSDGLYRRSATLLALMQLENQRNGLADAQVISARLLNVDRTASFDCLTVRIHASMRDVDVPATDTDEQARKKAKAASADEFTEIWTFVRRRDAKTRPDFDASQGKCPNCGAPFTGGAANKCSYCNAIVNSGNYDWVLSEIIQPSEYLPREQVTTGLEALKARDPDVAEELLQDRGLLLFWKWLEARAFGDAKRLQKLATPEGLATVSAEIDAVAARGQKFVVHDPAVGGATVVAVESSGGLDRVHVESRWSASIGTGQGFMPSEPYRLTVPSSRWSVVRRQRPIAAWVSRTSDAATAAAPLTNSDSAKCDYCGA